MRRHIWVGLDVGAETTSVCVINDDGEVLQQSMCATSLSSVDEQLRWLRRRRFATVGMEASGGMQLARALRSRGYTVDLYENRQLSKFLTMRRNKTDANDALGIAEAARLGRSTLSRVHLKSLDAQSLQSRLAIRRHVVGQRVGMVNLLCRQLEHYGGRISSAKRSKSFGTQAEHEISKLFGRKSTDLTRELRRLLSHCMILFEYERALDEEFRHLAKKHEVCRRLMTIPGVGNITALTYYALVSEPERFPSASRIGAYFGLTPKLHQSGLTSKAGRISKMGNAAGRAALVTASKGFMQWSNKDDGLRLWADRVQQRRGWQKARIALARKLAGVMLILWKSGQDYRPACLPAESKLANISEPDLGKPQPF